MKLIDLIPEENSHWFSAIFQIAESNLNNEEIQDNEEIAYVTSKYYSTTKLQPSHYHKPVILL
jgi:hypothetical protein